MHGGRGPVRFMTPRIGKKWWHSCIPNRLQERRLVWALKREIAALEDDFSTQYENARNEGQQEEAVIAWHHKSERPEAELGKIETNKLLRRASYRTIAEKLTAEKAQAYAAEHGVSVERAMRKIPHVSKRTVWDDVTAEMEELRSEMQVQRVDLMALENARLDQVFSKALSLFSKGDVPAGRLVIAVMGRRAKLNGLDAPTKIAPTDPTGEHPADSGAVDVNLLSEDTLRRVLRDEKKAAR